MRLYTENLNGLDANRSSRKKRHIKPRTTKPVISPAVVALAPVAVAAAVVPVPQSAPVVASNPLKRESALDKIIATVEQVAPVIVSTVAAARNQKYIEKLQRQRIEAGKEPLTSEEIDRYMDASAPVVKVKGGVDNNTSKALMVGGAALGLGVLYMMMNKSKAR